MNRSEGMEKDPEINKRTAIVTGARLGMGRDIAGCLLRKGYRVAGLSRELGQDGGKVSANTLELPCDVRDENCVQAVVEKVIQVFGTIDVLINAAGVSMPEKKNLEEVDTDLWKRIVDTNLLGTFLMCRAVLPHMKKTNSGYIINISSTAAFRSQAGNIPYSSSKYGVRALTEGLIEETRGTGIRVTSISPGPVDTNIWSHKTVPVAQERRSRMLRVEDITRIVDYLIFLPEHVHIDNVTVTPWFSLTAPAPP